MKDIIAFENGELNVVESIELFSYLIKTGTIWDLQGSYHRHAMDMIKNGWLAEDGEILDGGVWE